MDYSPVPIEEGEGTAERRSGDTQHDGSSHNLPPGVLYSGEHQEHKIILAFPLVLECDICWNWNVTFAGIGMRLVLYIIPECNGPP